MTAPISVPHRVTDMSAPDFLAMAERHRRARARDLWASPRRLDQVPTYERLNVPELAEHRTPIDRRAAQGIALGLVLGGLIWFAMIFGTVYLFR